MIGLPRLGDWAAVFRIHQWLKNFLIFVPTLSAHQISNTKIWLLLALSFASFSLCASAVYIVNDLVDLQSDRNHPRKSNRPFASGRVPIWVGIALVPVLLAGSLWLGFLVTGLFVRCLVIYYFLTCVYSFGLKRVIIVDCLTLSVLYTMRIIAGAAAAQLTLSFWLLAFTAFLFLSLAFVKRYAELELQIMSGVRAVPGRGYLTSDAPLIQTFGVTSGYASAIVLSLYINSDAVLKLYHHPEIIWGAVPVLLFWISWMWMQAHRGKMHDDPILFAVKDVFSVVAGLVFVLIVVAGTGDLPW